MGHRLFHLSTQLGLHLEEIARSRVKAADDSKLPFRRKVESLPRGLFSLGVEHSNVGHPGASDGGDGQQHGVVTQHAPIKTDLWSCTEGGKLGMDDLRKSR